MKLNLLGACLKEKFHDIVHSKNDVETVIGKTTNEFVEDLSALIKPNFPVDMPASIENLYVTSVYSYCQQGYAR